MSTETVPEEGDGGPRAPAEVPAAQASEASPERTPAGEAQARAEDEAADIARPVNTGERMTVIDTLRGFALGGVFLSNLYVWQSGRIFLSMERMKELMAVPLNIVIGTVLGFTLFGRAMTVFTFLFGLGFAIQMERAAARGDTTGRVYARRLGLMFLIGVTHLLLLWYGDILHLYAMVGLLLLLLRRLPDRAVLVLGLVLVIGGELGGRYLPTFVPRLWHSKEELEAIAALERAHNMAWRAEAFAGFTSGAYLDVVRANVMTWWETFFSLRHLGGNLAVLGKFLIGAYFGRRRLFREVPAHRTLFRRMVGYGLLVGLIGGAVNALTRLPSMQTRLGPDSLLMQIVSPVTSEMATLGMASFYIGGVTLLYQHAPWRKVLSVVAPAGQMALTNYLSQSAFSLVIFTGVGFGLLGQLNPLGCVVLVAVLFTLQVAFSHVWLAFFRFGPAEWVWRSLTYGKAQPMRKPRGAAT
ncbi:DUF418 domain-containing protein [Chondromyces apiculatus]|uniref:DUF418 domain-containing protein n=1 Tax=Chondromyces apiculatus DSM 436 TaxID=1192034 RepID=A0A017SXW1_9BACT|nr:DUF418 domain-containing protein [Chondromyces apiculatus]EYF01121.1 Hypothetical protein CAP_8626 [Chondromyces apiculatus DSM 436]